MYTEGYSVMGLGMNGRKPACISVTLTEDNNDLTNVLHRLVILATICNPCADLKYLLPQFVISAPI